MLTHFWHLLWRSLVDFPSLLSGNWLGTILLPLGLFALFEVKPLRRGWSVMTTEAKKEFWRNSGVLVAVYLLLFTWVVARDIYRDHEDLVHRIADLKAPPPELDAQIVGSSEGDANKEADALIVILVRLNNGLGRPRPISNWAMTVSLGSSPALSPDPFALPAPEWKIPMRNHPGGFMTLEESKFCPVITENPLPEGANRECWFMGYFRGRHKTFSESEIKVKVTFNDTVTGKTRTMERVVFPIEGK
jgi:hypothetical protein